MSQTAVEGRTRRYSSPRRALQAVQTRAAILDAAARLFSEGGWAATGMRDVAREAGVAVETVYANFGSKADLLRAALDVAIVGDNVPRPLAERPEFQALAASDIQQRAAAAASLVCDINVRAHGLECALLEAAAGDPSLAERLSANDETRRLSVAAGIEAVAGRPARDVERDGIWAVTSPEVYHLLVLRSAWPLDRYRSWLADTILRLLERQPDKQRRTR